MRAKQPGFFNIVKPDKSRPLYGRAAKFGIRKDLEDEDDSAKARSGR